MSATPIEKLAAARAFDSVAQVFVDLTALAFAAGYCRTCFASLDWSDLAGFADRYGIPRLMALTLQTELRGRPDINPRALAVIGAMP